MNPPVEFSNSAWNLIDRLPISFYIKDRESRFVYLNRAAADALGVKDPEDALGKTDHDFFESSLATQWLEQERLLMACKEGLLDQTERELRVDKHSPSPWVLTSKLPTYDSQGMVSGLIGISKEITSTRNRLDLIGLAVEGAQDGLWYKNLETNEVWFSKRWKEMLGYNDDELPNKPEVFRTRVHEDDRDRVEHTFSAHLRRETPYYECRYRMCHRDQRWLWILSRGSARFNSSGKPIEIAGSHTDITASTVKNELYEKILDWLPALVFVKDSDRRFRYVNSELEKYLGLDRSLILGRTDREVNPDTAQAERFLADDEDVLNGMNEKLIPDEPLTDQRSKEVRRLQTRKRLFHHPSNDPQPNVLGISTDITEAVAAKQTLRALKESLSETLAHLIAILSAIEKSDTEFDACAVAVRQLQDFGESFGFTSVMLSMLRIEDGHPFIIADPEYSTGKWKAVAQFTKRQCDTSPEKMDVLPRVLRAGVPLFVSDSRTHPYCDRPLVQKHNIVSQYIIPLQTASLKIGTLQIEMGELDALPSQSEIYDAVGAHLSVVIERHRRLAEIEQKNARFLSTAKLFAFSAAGTAVIHELKHSLNNYVLLLNRTEKNPTVRSCVPAMDFLKDTRRFVDDWGDQFSQHLQQAKRSITERTTEVSDSVRQVVDLAYDKAKMRGSRISWKEFVPPGITVPCSSLELREMVSVFVFNAIDAKAKSIRIELTRVQMTLPQSGMSREYARLTVSDDGHGIATDYSHQIGKFGWTSKASAGHGVGLTIVSTLAEALEGGMVLRSGGRSVKEPETVFELLLPIAK